MLFIYLDGLIPPSRDNNGLGNVWGEPHTRDPVGVPLLLNSKLALGQRVPQLDGVVPGATHDLTVVRGKGHAQHVLK